MAYYLLNTDKPEELAEKIKNKLVSMNFYNTDNPPPYSFRPFGDIYFTHDVKPEQGVIHRKQAGSYSHDLCGSFCNYYCYNKLH